MIAALSALAVCGIILFIVFSANGRKAEAYREAVRLSEEGRRAEAFRKFEDLGKYRDAEERAAELEALDPALPYKAAEKGETVLFGRWEQDHNDRNGPEPVEWLVLDRIDGRLLLLSSSCLAGMAYNSEAFEPVTWETCSLRKWLNGAFLEGAFTEAERAWIPSVINMNPDHSIVETPGGNETEDRVFLLSEQETVIYLKDESDQQSIGKAFATEEAREGGLQVSGDGFAAWWLRSPGMYEYVAQFVDQEGIPYANGANADIDYLCGVRPVIWLDADGKAGGGQE